MRPECPLKPPPAPADWQALATLRLMVAEERLKMASRWSYTAGRMASRSWTVSAVPRQPYLPVWRQLVLPFHLLGLDAFLGGVGAVAGDVKRQVTE